MSLRVLSRGLIFLVSMILIAYLIRLSQSESVFDKAWVDSQIRGRGALGELIFVALAALFAAVGMPRQIVSFLAGYAFGFVGGTALGLAATICACVITFFFARFMGRDFVAGRFPGRVRRIDGFLSENPFTMTLLIRFLPAGSNLVTNLVAGVSSVRALPFFGGSGVGYIPQTAVFALVGSGIEVDTEMRIVMSVLLFVASAILGVYLYRKYRHGRTFDEVIERQISGGD